MKLYSGNIFSVSLLWVTHPATSTINISGKESEEPNRRYKVSDHLLTTYLLLFYREISLVTQSIRLSTLEEVNIKEWKKGRWEVWSWVQHQEMAAIALTLREETETGKKNFKSFATSKLRDFGHALISLGLNILILPHRYLILPHRVAKD